MAPARTTWLNTSAKLGWQGVRVWSMGYPFRLELNMGYVGLHFLLRSGSVPFVFSCFAILNFQASPSFFVQFLFTFITFTLKTAKNVLFFQKLNQTELGDVNCGCSIPVKSSLLSKKLLKITLTVVTGVRNLTVPLTTRVKKQADSLIKSNRSNTKRMMMCVTVYILFHCYQSTLRQESTVGTSVIG